MKWPVILILTLCALPLPILAAVWRRRSTDRPMRLVAWWYVLLVVQNVTGIASMLYFKSNNLAFPQLFMPFEATIVLLAIAEWQVYPVVRTTVRVAIPCYWITWAVALAYIEPLGSFSTFSGPILALLVLAFALVAFVSRLQLDAEPALDSAWGWMLPGLAMFFAINATTTIVLAVGMARKDDLLMMNAIVVRGWIYLLATLLISWGFIWPTRHRSSGDSSSPLPSR